MIFSLHYDLINGHAAKFYSAFLHCRTTLKSNPQKTMTKSGQKIICRTGDPDIIMLCTLFLQCMAVVPRFRLLDCVSAFVQSLKRGSS